MITWTKTPKDLRDFNGCVQTCIIGQKEFGIFKEKYGSLKWNYRARPLDSNGKATDSWGSPRVQSETKRDIIEHCEKVLT